MFGHLEARGLFSLAYPISATTLVGHNMTYLFTITISFYRDVYHHIISFAGRTSLADQAFCASHGKASKLDCCYSTSNTFLQKIIFQFLHIATHVTDKLDTTHLHLYKKLRHENQYRNTITRKLTY